MIYISVEIDKTVIELTEEEINDYLPLHPEHTPSSVLIGLAKLKEEFGQLDPITVGHLLREVEYGGRGFVVPQDNETLYHIVYLCNTALGVPLPKQCKRAFEDGDFITLRERIEQLKASLDDDMRILGERYADQLQKIFPESN